MILASGTITIYHVRDITATTWYYKLQSSTLSPPSKPTAATPSGWTTTEPTYTEGSTNSLYVCEKTTFSDGTFEYSDVSLSSSYEAAKAAYNRAANLDSSLNSQGVFNRLTNNGALQGIYMENGNLYINMSYLKTGALVVRDISNNEIARFDATNRVAKVGGWDVNATRLSASDSYGYKCEVSPLNSDFHKERTYTSSGRMYAEKQGVSVGHEIITDPTEGEEAGSYSNVFSAYKLVDSETSTPGNERVDYQGYVITDDTITAKRVHGAVDNSEIETDLIYQEQVNYTTKKITRTFNGEIVNDFRDDVTWKMAADKYVRVKSKIWFDIDVGSEILFAGAAASNVKGYTCHTGVNNTSLATTAFVHNVVDTLKNMTQADKTYHLGFYLDADGDLCYDMED